MRGYAVSGPGCGLRVTVTDEIPIMGAQVTYEAMWPAILEKAVAQRMGGYDIMGRAEIPLWR